jgi:hypothetical protein
VHQGASLRGSDYIAFVKASDNDLWSESRGNTCKAVPWESVKSQEPLMLFYSKVPEGGNSGELSGEPACKPAAAKRSALAGNQKAAAAKMVIDSPRSNERKFFCASPLMEGYSMIAIPGDGNCLLHALCDQLNREPGPAWDHKFMRSLAVEYMETNPKIFLTDMTSNAGDNSHKALKKRFSEYLHKIAQDGYWLGSLEIQALSLALNRQIAVLGFATGDHWSSFPSEAFFERGTEPFFQQFKEGEAVWARIKEGVWGKCLVEASSGGPNEELKLVVVGTDEKVSVHERWVRVFDKQNSDSSVDGFDKEPLRVAWMEQEFGGNAHFNSLVLGVRAASRGSMPSLPWALDREYRRHRQ